MEEEFEVPVRAEDRSRIQKLCMHELGHYVVGRDLGADPTEITVTFAGPEKFLGNTSMSIARRLVTMDAVREYLECRICILMAGTLGEHLSVDPMSLAPINEERWRLAAMSGYERQSSSSSDKNKGDELLRMLLFMDGIEEPVDQASLNERLGAISERIWTKAVTILSKVATEFYCVGEMMADKVRFQGAREVSTRAEIEGFFAAARNRESD